MARGRRDGVLIAGGGVAGCLAALALARRRPEVPLLIVEEKDRFGGDGFQYLFDSELDAKARAPLAPIAGKSWPGFYVAFLLLLVLLIVRVVSLRAWVKPLKIPPRSDRYSPRPATANRGVNQ